MIHKDTPIEAPGGFAPVIALGMDDGTGQLSLVSAERPLPVVSQTPTAPPVLAGSTSTAILAGPFVPAPLAPVFLALAGVWTGSVQLMRSTDAGATLLPVTLGGTAWGGFAANACEPVWVESEPAASLYLGIAPTSGTIAYRVSQ